MALSDRIDAQLTQVADALDSSVVLHFEQIIDIAERLKIHVQEFFRTCWILLKNAWALARSIALQCILLPVPLYTASVGWLLLRNSDVLWLQCIGGTGLLLGVAAVAWLIWSLWLTIAFSQIINGIFGRQSVRWSGKAVCGLCLVVFIDLLGIGALGVWTQSHPNQHLGTPLLGFTQHALRIAGESSPHFVPSIDVKLYLSSNPIIDIMSVLFTIGMVWFLLYCAAAQILESRRDKLKR
jgi:hypothetical protein